MNVALTEREKPSLFKSGSLGPQDLLWAAGLFILSLLLYIKTLCPTVYEGDSGELLTAAATLGVAHPTGFPLYLLTGKLFSLIIPFGSVAYRINLLSAFCAAATVAVLYLIFRILRLKRVCGIAASLFFAFSDTLWSHATAARVYSMAALFMLLSLGLALQWQKTCHNRYLLWLGVILGLASGTHILALLVIPTLFLIIGTRGVRIFKERVFFLSVAIAAFLTLILYSYIPLRAAQHPYINMENPSSLSRFLGYITQRTTYAFKMQTRTLSNAGETFLTYLRLSFQEFTGVSFLLSLCGLIYAWRRRKKVILFSLPIIILNILIMLNYGNKEDLFILFRYLFPTYIVLALCLGYGFQGLAVFIHSRRNKYLTFVSSIFLCLLPLVALFNHYHKNDRSQNYIVRDYAFNLLTSLPRDSILIFSGDAVFGPLNYLYGVEKIRPDVILIDKNLLSWDWYCRDIARRHKGDIPLNIIFEAPQMRLDILITAAMDKKEIFSTSPLVDKYKIIPWGLLVQIKPKDSLVDFSEVKKTNERLWRGYRLDGLLDPAIHKDYMVEELVHAYSKSLNNLGAFYSRYGLMEDEIKAYQASLQYNPENFASLFNLGQLYINKGEIDKGEQLLKKATRINPGFFKTAALGPTLAQQDLSQRLSSAPGLDSAQTHLQNGVHYGLSGEHDQAIAEFQKAVSINPRLVQGYLNLGNAYMQKQEVDKAIAMYKKAIEVDVGKNSSLAYLNLGAIYVNIKKDYSSGVANLKKYLELNPDGADSEVIRQQLALLEFLVRSQNHGRDK